MDDDTWSLPSFPSALLACIGGDVETHLTSSNTFAISSGAVRSNFRIEGGEARV
jgi:hypothetical protein